MGVVLSFDRSCCQRQPKEDGGAEAVTFEAGNRPCGGDPEIIQSIVDIEQLAAEGGNTSACEIEQACGVPQGAPDNVLSLPSKRAQQARARARLLVDEAASILAGFDGDDRAVSWLLEDCARMLSL